MVVFSVYFLVSSSKKNDITIAILFIFYLLSFIFFILSDHWLYNTNVGKLMNIYI